MILIESINTEDIRKNLDKSSQALKDFAAEKNFDLKEKASGINLLEQQYLVTKGVNDKVIPFLRNLQELRSSRFAHKPSSTVNKRYAQAKEFFKLDTMSLKNSYDRILVMATDVV